MQKGRQEIIGQPNPDRVEPDGYFQIGSSYVCARCGASVPRGGDPGRVPMDIHNEWHIDVDVRLDGG